MSVVIVKGIEKRHCLDGSVFSLDGKAGLGDVRRAFKLIAEMYSDMLSRSPYSLPSHLFIHSYCPC